MPDQKNSTDVVPMAVDLDLPCFLKSAKGPLGSEVVRALVSHDSNP